MLDAVRLNPDVAPARHENEALSRFATGVGRRYMMLLSVVVGRLDAVLHEWPATDPARDDVAAARIAAGHLTELTRMILATGRSSPLQPSTIDVSDKVANVAANLRPILPPTVDLVIDLAPRACLAFVDPSQLEEAISNLVMNALDAMPEGGTLRLATQRLEVHRKEGTERDHSTPGSHVAVLVGDTGRGMAAGIRDRAQEPFFTTKPGRSIGLGLSAVRGFIEQSGGFVELHSRAGRGTTVRLIVPRAAHFPVAGPAAHD